MMEEKRPDWGSAVLKYGILLTINTYRIIRNYMFCLKRCRQKKCGKMRPRGLQVKECVISVP